MARLSPAAEPATRWPAAHILVVESEQALAASLRARLRAERFSVSVCAMPDHVSLAQMQPRPDLLLVDVDGAGASCWSLVDKIRASDARPIVVISERSGQDDIVAALERGADDYITKPLPMDELLARIRVALRRKPRFDQSRQAPVHVGDLEIDVERQRVSRGGRLVRLTATEYTLLTHFATHLDKLLTERMLVERVWGREHPTKSHLLHVYIARLRKKLEADPTSPLMLITERGAGYRWPATAYRAQPSARTHHHRARMGPGRPDARIEKILIDCWSLLTAF